MDVQITHHVDASEPDAQGMYDYRYEYDLYTFREGGLALVARSYTDEPHNAHFLSLESGGRRTLLTRADRQRPLFSEAIDYLKGSGKQEIWWLTDGGYEPVES